MLAEVGGAIEVEPNGKNEWYRQKKENFDTIWRTLERRLRGDADAVICGGHPYGQYRIAGKD
jgi:hypothetical protein